MTFYLMRMAEAFGVTAQSGCLLGFPTVQKVGRDKATSSMEVVGKFGVTGAPTQMGMALLAAAQVGKLVQSLSLVLTSLPSILDRRTRATLV